MNLDVKFSATDAFLNQIKGMEIDEARKIDLLGKSAFSARPLIKYASDKLGYQKIKTKNVDGELFIIRIS